MTTKRTSRTGRRKKRVELATSGVAEQQPEPPFAAGAEPSTDEFKKYKRMAMGIAYSRSFQVSDPESVVNAALLKTMQRFVPAKGEFHSLMYCIVYFALIDAYRKERMARARCQPLSDEQDKPDATASAWADLRESREWLLVALALLSDEDQTLLYWKYQKDLTYKELSQALCVNATAPSAGDPDVPAAGNSSQTRCE